MKLSLGMQIVLGNRSGTRDALQCENVVLDQSKHEELIFQNTSPLLDELINSPYGTEHGKGNWYNIDGECIEILLTLSHCNIRFVMVGFRTL